MSISIEVQPEVMERLEQAATARGLSVESYVEELIEQHLSQSERTSSISAEEIERVLDSLAEGSEDHPVLHPEGYTRQSIYDDYD